MHIGSRTECASIRLAKSEGLPREFGPVKLLHPLMLWSGMLNSLNSTPNPSTLKAHGNSDLNKTTMGTTPYQTKPNQTKPNQTKPNQTKPNQTKPNQTEPNRRKQPDGTSVKIETTIAGNETILRMYHFDCESCYTLRKFCLFIYSPSFVTYVLFFRFMREKLYLYS